MISIKTCCDPRPITLVLANILRRSAADPELSSIMAELVGVLGLQSSTDPQCATIHFDKGTVVVANGLDPSADPVITTDFNAPTGPDAPRPGLRETLELARSAVRRPLFAQAASKLLEPPLPSWRAAAEPFWQTCCDRSAFPTSLRIVCTDDGAEGGELLLERGDDRGSAGRVDPVEIHANARVLARCFVGEAVLGEEAFAGQIALRGTFADLSILTGASLAMMLGD